MVKGLLQSLLSKYMLHDSQWHHHPLVPWIVWYLTHKRSWQHMDVVNSHRVFALIVKGGTGISQNDSVPVGLVIQGVYEKVIPTPAVPAMSLVFSCSLENTYYLCDLSFIISALHRKKEREVPQAMYDWGYTSAKPFQLTASCMAGHLCWYVAKCNS